MNDCCSRSGLCRMEVGRMLRGTWPRGDRRQHDVSRMISLPADHISLHEELPGLAGRRISDTVSNE